MSPPFVAPGRTMKRLILAFLALNLVLLFCYIAFDYQVLLHQGAAVKNLLAQEIIDSGRLLPPDWHYADDDLWEYAVTLPLLPLLALLPNGFAVHAIGGFITAALVLAATWSVTGVLGQSRNVRLTGLVVLASGLSVAMAEQLFGQQVGGMMYAAGCFLFTASWRYYQANGHARIVWGGVAALLLLLVFLANPARAFTLYCLPLAFSALVMRWQALEGRIGPLPARRFAILGWLLAMLAAGLAGAGLHVLAQGGLNLSAAAAEPSWLDFDAMLAHLQHSVRGLLEIFGGLPQAGTRVASAFGAYQAVRLLAVLVLLGLMPWGLVTMLRSRLAPRLYFAVFTLASVLPALVLELATDAPNTGMLVAPLLYLVIVLLTVVLEENHTWVSGALGRSVVLVLASSAVITYTVPLPGTLVGGQGAARQRLVTFLQNENLVYGFADSAQAGPLTLLSAQRLRVRPVRLQDGLPQPEQRQVAERWYAPQAWDGSVFLLLDGKDAAALDWVRLQALAGKAPRMLQFEGWQIAVFEQGFAHFLPAWNRDMAVPLHIAIGKHSLHKVGVLNASTHELAAEEGEAGMLHYGPYLTLPAGRYSATFVLETTGEEALDFGAIEVASNKGSLVHARRALTRHGVTAETLAFTLEQDVRDLELRVQVNGGGEVKLSALDLVRMSARK